MLNFYAIRDQIKAYKNKKLYPLAEFFYKKCEITSNKMSFLGLICGISSVFFLFSHHYIFIALITIFMIADIFDGAIAQFENKKNGWLVDNITDRLISASLIIGFAMHNNFANPFLILAAYLLVHIFYIYEKLILKKDPKILHPDGILLFSFIFSFYEFGIYFLFYATLLNFIKEFALANFISFMRPVLAVFALWQFKNQPIILGLSIAIIILLDALDGIIARRSGKLSKFGAYIDIAADRAVELIVLFTYGYWGLISYIFPILFTLRGLATDFLRLLNNIYKDSEYKTPLSIGKADNRFMRGFYAAVKLAAFALIPILPKTGLILMIIALATNLYRGLPVIFSARSKVLIKTFYKAITKKI